MLQFIVPQFIERKAKIVGPLTFTQFLYVAGAGLVIVVLWLLVSSFSFYLFLFLAILTAALGLALAFFKMGPYDLPSFLKNALLFMGSKKLYIWQKKTIVPKMIRLEKKPEKQGPVSKTPELKLGGRSHLKKLSTKIETSK